MKISRVFAMPNSETFTVPPIGDFVNKYLLSPILSPIISVDPFARNNTWFTHTNDLDPSTLAKHHMDAEAFLHMLHGTQVTVDLGIFDPPYSPRQISECYKSIGLKVGNLPGRIGRIENTKI